MARIAGIDIPKNKRGVISLTYIFGIGNSRAKEILANAGVDESKKVSDWSDSDISKIREAVGSYTIEGELRSENQLNIKRLALDPELTIIACGDPNISANSFSNCLTCLPMVYISVSITRWIASISSLPHVENASGYVMLVLY